MTRGERAAIRYVRELVPAQVLESFQQLGNEDYRRVLATCRADMRLGADRGDRPYKDVMEAVPDEHRAVIERPLMLLLDAEFDRRRATERAAFLIGLAVGRGLASPSERRKGGRA